MENITNMSVMQGRTFAPDIIPYRLIITQFGTTHLKQALGFSSATWNQESWEYVFQDGILENKGGGGPTPITWAGFNDRRIVVQVLGDSDAAHAAYASISRELSELDPSFRGATPLVLTEETSCSARLNFDWSTLLNPALVGQVSTKIEASTEKIKRKIKGLNLRLTLSVTAADEKLNEYGITYADQTLIIEPRVDVPLSEQTYFTSSPCDSDTHLKLVSELETSLLRTQKETQPGRSSKGKRGR